MVKKDGMILETSFFNAKEGRDDFRTKERTNTISL